jgi:hypothetical protein
MADTLIFSEKLSLWRQYELLCQMLGREPLDTPDNWMDNDLWAPGERERIVKNAAAEVNDLHEKRETAGADAGLQWGAF